MLQDLGLIGTLQDEDLSPEEPDTEPEEEVSESGLERGESPGRGAGARGENGRDTADSSRGAFREEKARERGRSRGENSRETADSSRGASTNLKKKLGTRGVKDFNTNFEFGERDILTDDSWVMADILKQIKNKRTATTLDQKIDKIRKKRKAEAPQSYSEDASKFDDSLTFEDMNLSRPILKQACVPVGLLGRDLCACAATGTGKTAAFVLPVLERLIYKPRTSQVTRVLILVPTRELGIQVHSVARQLAQFSSITTCLAVGGLDLKSQEAALRAGPDILIATPGRLIDHLHNTPTFELSHIEILILDEADRMLDEYFEEQMKEIIRLCAHNRQTMLFSATMTEEVKELAAVSLNKPIRIFVNSNTDVAPFLRQEFVRIRQNREGDREAVVAALLTRTFQDHVMCFTQTRKQAHRLHILLGLMGLKVGELHGELSQNQRRFKDDQIDILVATDVAARGLDIDGVKTFRDVITKLEKDVEAVVRLEREEREFAASEAKLSVAQKRLEGTSTADQSRVWFQTQQERKQSRVSKALQEFDLALRGKKKRQKFLQEGKRKEPTAEERAQFEILKAQMFAERAAKRDRRPKRYSEVHGYTTRVLTDVLYCVPAATNQKGGKGGKKSVFDKELTNTSSKALKHYRAGPSFEDRKRLGIERKRPGGPKFNRKKK
ncbi:putative ATP-dependent RNA helicase DDX27 [Dissostichus eleginoides]|uniref:ATP-dependent RNA helicase DDX27 n=1 Tax=Dissostichus eleginoides TaxID=100907 RepID=A0AAD9CEW7_DISEL|nr:putative ATP-dependent RNA helicase DDX27 [Dissostichus eleginoides]